jgi:4-amino-4-deoxy-L-arabinose transferase-like glycosyltransferase
MGEKVSGWLTARGVELLMLLLHALWLGAIWWTGASAAETRVLWLLGLTAVSTPIFLYLPDHFWNRLYMLAYRGRSVLLLALCLLTLFYATQQRIWPFDEQSNFRAALKLVQDGLPGLVDEYERHGWLGRQHPPLGPLLFGLGAFVLGPYVLATRIVTIFFLMGTTALLYDLGRRLYGENTAVLAVLFFFSFPLVWRLGTVAMVEMPLTFFFTLCLWAFARAWQGENNGLPGWGLLAFAAGFLTKYTMLLVIPVLVGLALAWGKMGWWWRYKWVWGGTAVLLLSGWLLLSALGGFLQVQLQTLVHYATMVMTDQYGRQLLLETITNRLPSAIGVYHAPLLLVGGWWLWQRRSVADQLLLIWIMAVWLPLFLTLPDHRYFLCTFPALALLLAEGGRRLSQTQPGDPIPYQTRLVATALWLNSTALWLFVDWQRSVLLFLP